MEHLQGYIFPKKYTISLAINIAGFLILFFLLTQSISLPVLTKFSFALFSNVHSLPADRCSGRYVYMYDLPAHFNTDLLRNCSTLNPWTTNMCKFLANSGMGPRLTDSSGVVPKAGWYSTDQFTLEIIFHNRMKQYKCLTTNSSMAEAIFIPFYAGLDIGRHLSGYNTSVRDSLSLDLARWLKSRPEWLLHGGRDHFFVSGRVTYDYRRPNEEEKSWGNKLMFLPETQNFTILAIESDAHFTANDVAIPYPTYFHPSNEGQVASWQETVRSSNRPWLFSFAGARRPNNKLPIRDHLINQCAQSDECRLLDCGSKNSSCDSQESPTQIIKLFKHSKFCLQPAGDSFTRRSTFDSILSGCIPVFFHPASAYTQYVWHFPKNYTKYSVFIPEDEVREGKASIEEVLLNFGEEQVREMRENVISMIPGIVYNYKDPRYEVESIRDAFDVAIDRVIERVKRLKGGFGSDNINDLITEGNWGRFFGRNG